MFTTSHRHRQSRASGARGTPRRGVALVFVMVFVIAMGALAMSSIFMASNSTLLAKSYDRERDLRFAADAALAIGKARVNSDPSLLVPDPDPTKMYKVLMKALPIRGADDVAMPGIEVDVYVGLTGSSSGQYGRFASIVAHARDARAGYGFIRRLELTQESFAKFAYWSDQESNSGNVIFFNNADELWGPVWSNDEIHIGSGGATFHDQVGTAKKINGKSNGTFTKAPQENMPMIKLPSTTALTALKNYADFGSMSIDAQTSAGGDEAKLRDRLEFIAFDIDGMQDSTGADEGFVRHYQAYAGNDNRLRGDWPGTQSSVPDQDDVHMCGDWHYTPMVAINGVKLDAQHPPKFFPASVHDDLWFQTLITAALVERPHRLPAGNSSIANYVNAEKNATTRQIMNNPNARCFLAGDPHLVSTDRVQGQPRPAHVGGTYSAADVQKGGEDTTFTPKGRYGQWVAPPGTVADTLVKRRPWDGRHLRSIGRTYNPNARGVIYSDGNIGVSGTVNGLVTLYSKGVIVVLDDLRYANDPVKGVCHDILGMISDFDVVIADNALNAPIPTLTSSQQNYGYLSADNTPDVYIHSVLMSLNTSFRVENYNAGARDANDCEGTDNGRGCIYLSGGIIQKARGAVGTSVGTGYAKRYSYDRCAVQNPPPYFPTTGRFQDNRYLELDPTGFDPVVYFKTLNPDP